MSIARLLAEAKRMLNKVKQPTEKLATTLLDVLKGGTPTARLAKRLAAIMASEDDPLE